VLGLPQNSSSPCVLATRKPVHVIRSVWPQRSQLPEGFIDGGLSIAFTGSAHEEREQSDVLGRKPDQKSFDQPKMDQCRCEAMLIAPSEAVRCESNTAHEFNGREPGKIAFGILDKEALTGIADGEFGMGLPECCNPAENAVEICAEEVSKQPNSIIFKCYLTQKTRRHSWQAAQLVRTCGKQS
jgi:hypothetical protein